MRRKSFVMAVVLIGVACGGDDSTGGGAGSTGQTAGSMSPGAGGSGGTSGTAGNGGSHAAGSTMSGGAAGTATGTGGGMAGGADAGASKCMVLNPNACDTCVFGKCCDAYAACNNDDDCNTAMGHLAECVAADSSMSTQCYDDFATTNDMAVALRMCVKTSCDATCKTVTP